MMGGFLFRHKYFILFLLFAIPAYIHKYGFDAFFNCFVVMNMFFWPIGSLYCIHALTMKQRNCLNHKIFLSLSFILLIIVSLIKSSFTPIIVFCSIIVTCLFVEFILMLFNIILPKI